MNLINLPNEILWSVSDHLTRQDLSFLLRASRQYRMIFEPVLYQHDADDTRPAALLWAAERGRLEIVKRALAVPRLGGFPHDGTGHGPLGLAASGGHGSVVQYLLGADGIDPEEQYAKQGQQGPTPLFMASSRGFDDVVRILLVTGRADPNARCHFTTWGDSTPLQEASVSGHLEVVKALLSAPEIEVNAQDWTGQTALMVATQYGRLETVKCLLEMGKADPSVQDVRGRTAMHHAPSFEILNVLLKARGADPLLLDQDDTCPLASAVHDIRSTRALLQIEGICLDCGRAG